MKVNKKHETITASVTVYATFDMSEVADWFDQRLGQEDPEDAWSLRGRYGEFLSVVGDDETVRVFMNNGGTFDDYDVDHERYLTHCFDEFE
jgi:hypothetical protein